MGYGDFHERGDGKDYIEDGKDEDLEISPGIEIAAASRGVFEEECHNHDNRHGPAGEVPPRLKDFLFHLVGDEGEEEN